MAYKKDMGAAAHRHLDAAEALEKRHESVAAYLYGLAAECALKACIPELAELRDREVGFAHFPKLRTLALDRLVGRRGQALRRWLEQSAALSHWDITIRYSATGEVKPDQVERWASAARDAVNLMTSLAG